MAQGHTNLSSTPSVPTILLSKISSIRLFHREQDLKTKSFLEIPSKMKFKIYIKVYIFIGIKVYIFIGNRYVFCFQFEIKIPFVSCSLSELINII